MDQQQKKIIQDSIKDAHSRIGKQQIIYCT